MVNGRENQYTDDIDAARSGWSAPHPLSFLAQAADFTIFPQGVKLCGWSVRETAGAAATGRFYNTATVGQGEVIGGVSLAANAADNVNISDEGVLCEGGLSFNRISGTLDVIVYIRHWMG